MLKKYLEFLTYPYLEPYSEVLSLSNADIFEVLLSNHKEKRVTIH